mgnify:CR=1 FL=1
MEELLNIYDLAKEIKGRQVPYSAFGLLFCFGSSLVSQIIMAKTRQFKDEIVPSHVAILYGGFIFESTTDVVNVNKKQVKSGVRMWLLKDFIEAEKSKLTKYYLYRIDRNKFDKDTMLDCLHLPYGKDTIVDFILKDKSEGTNTEGLICSQYANKCIKLSRQRCPSPADLFRIVKDLERE